ncbi:MAG: phosphotransferase [Pseudomonadota bacterium]
MSGRASARARLLDQAGWSGAEEDPLPGDASFRRYIRLRRDGASAMLMDSPPDSEPLAPFLDIAARLRRLGLAAPSILAADVAAGFALLEDFGDETFARALAAGAPAATLYDQAIDVLIALRRAAAADPAAISSAPPYDAAAMAAEAGLFTQWWLPAAGLTPDPGRFGEAVAELAAFASAGRETLVLRDYHVENLMRRAGRSGLDACGLLDFQDARLGPAAYDVVSLVDDARRDVTDAEAARLEARYAAAFDDYDPSVAAALSALRSLKILGIFVRLAKRDGKPRYLAHLPRVWRMLERRLTHPRLSTLAEWIDAAAPPHARGRVAA